MDKFQEYNQGIFKNVLISCGNDIEQLLKKFRKIPMINVANLVYTVIIEWDLVKTFPRSIIEDAIGNLEEMGSFKKASLLSFKVGMKNEAEANYQKLLSLCGIERTENNRLLIKNITNLEETIDLAYIMGKKEEVIKYQKLQKEYLRDIEDAKWKDYFDKLREKLSPKK